MNRPQMETPEVKDRLVKIKAYNACFVGTKHVVRASQITDFMEKEWFVNPAEFKREIANAVRSITEPAPAEVSII